jgi:hypothetical protein
VVRCDLPIMEGDRELSWQAVCGPIGCVVGGDGIDLAQLGLDFAQQPQEAVGHAVALSSCHAEIPEPPLKRLLLQAFGKEQQPHHKCPQEQIKGRRGIHRRHTGCG